MSFAALVRDAQAILTRYLVPDGLTAEQAIDELLGLLDGPRYRDAEASERAGMIERHHHAAEACAIISDLCGTPDTSRAIRAITTISRMKKDNPDEQHSDA